MWRFAKATGQYWKYRVFLVLMVLGVPALYVQHALDNRHSILHSFLRGFLPYGPTVLICFGVVFLGMVWGAAAVRCPECGCRLGWYHMTHGSFRGAYTRMESETRCPRCEFAPEAPQESAPPPPEPLWGVPPPPDSGPEDEGDRVVPGVGSDAEPSGST